MIRDKSCCARRAGALSKGSPSAVADPYLSVLVLYLRFVMGCWRVSEYLTLSFCNHFRKIKITFFQRKSPKTALS